MKIVNSILTILFLLFAVAQWNDPDPGLWIAIYGGIALISGYAILGKYNKIVIYLALAICVLGLGVYFPNLINWVKMGTPNIAESMKAEKDYIEFVREFFGLLIALMVMIFHFFQMRKMEKKEM